MRRDISTNPDGSIVTVLTMEGEQELSEWQKTLQRDPPAGMSRQAVWVSENSIAFGTFPDSRAAGASTPATAAAPLATGVPVSKPADDGLEGKTVAELQTQCGMRGISYPARAIKADLLQLLRGS